MTTYDNNNHQKLAVNIEGIDADDRDDLIELFVGIQEECGLLPDCESSLDAARMSLSRALKELAKVLAASSSQSSWIEYTSTDPSDLVLLAEKMALATRKACDNYSTTIHETDKKITSSLNEIKEICKGTKMLVRIQLWVQCLGECFQGYIKDMKNLIQMVIHTLPTIYENDRLFEQIEQWSTWLEKCPFGDELLRTGTNELVQLLGGQDTIANEIIIRQFGESNSAKNVQTAKFYDIHNEYDISETTTTPLSLLSSSPLEAVKSFLERKNSTKPKGLGSATFLLVVGPEGSGKSYLCDSIERLAGSSASVIRPFLPFDMLSSSLGGMEDNIVSLFSYAIALEQKTIILLDDVEYLLGAQESSGIDWTMSEEISTSIDKQSHLHARTKSLVLSIFDKLQYHGDNLIVICTSKSDISDEIRRFHGIFRLFPPNFMERKNMINSIFDSEKSMDTISKNDNDISSALQQSDELLNTVVDCTVGLSYAELSQYCSQVVRENSSMPCSTNQYLEFLKQKIQTVTPKSMKGGILDDFVDLKVWTAKDLLATIKDDSQPILPSLYGKTIETAWQDLQRLIVTPLCRAKELQSILFGNSNTTGKVVSGGVLLTGQPGTGKTSLAYHCAAVASKLLPSVKLVDVSCTSLVQKEVGGSERAVYRLFQAAKDAAPCILLLDGIENIAAVRGNDNTTEGTMDRILSTLLTLMDGVDNDNVTNTADGNNRDVIIIGITHNVKWIDPAILRPGRLGKIIELGLPDAPARKQIIMKEMTQITNMTGVGDQSSSSLLDISISNGIDQSMIIDKTAGLTGADIVHLVREAKIQVLTSGDASDAINIQSILDYFLSK